MINAMEGKRIGRLTLIILARPKSAILTVLFSPTRTFRAARSEWQRTEKIPISIVEMRINLDEYNFVLPNKPCHVLFVWQYKSTQTFLIVDPESLYFQRERNHSISWTNRFNIDFVNNQADCRSASTQ